MFEKVKTIVADQLGIDEVDDIGMQTSLIEDLEADSLDAVEIVMAIEDEFDIEVPDEDAENFKTIKQICEYIEEHM
ncbi:acyl carrier protein [Peptoclostridium acidaminophilum]|uniref:acyl carrier protein n=1 Tax=Peptoclostridium acidaminophilum TaxID=1731 RepID=UPI00046D5564